ncbi:unnamed protein product [Fusarium graminearum]|nr:unnamed protein product [Fusarium graminearum]
MSFTEAEGSFYLVNKASTRIVHAFEITQKLDFIVLKAIAHILGISFIRINKFHHNNCEHENTRNKITQTSLIRMSRSYNSSITFIIITCISW